MKAGDEVFARVRLLVARHLRMGVQELHATTSLESLDLDSLAALELVIEAEEAFGVDLRPAELGDLETLGDIATHICAAMMVAER